MVIKVFVLLIQDEFVGRTSVSSSSVATSLMDDTSPESAAGKRSVYRVPLQLGMTIELI